MKSSLVKGNVIFSGCVALLIAWFFAVGAIGESDTLTPEFFLILPIWAIGALLIWRFISKTELERSSYFIVVLVNFLPWLTIPIGLMFAFQFV